jgi:hypothetical protein
MNLVTQAELDSLSSKELLSERICGEGQLEEFYMPNHPNSHFRGRFTGNSYFMFDFHKQRRLELETEYRKRYG